MLGLLPVIRCRCRGVITPDATPTPHRIASGVLITMTEKIRFINFSPDEFISGVIGMRAIDVGVYWAACSLMYSSGGPINENDERLLRLFSDHKNAIKASINRLIENGKLQRLDSNLAQTRVTKELEKAQTRARKGAESAKTRWGKATTIEQKQRVTGNAPIKIGNANQEPRTTNQEPRTNTTPIVPKGTSGRGYTVDFESWWSEYPNKVGKPVAAKKFKIAIQKASVGELVDGVRRYVRDKPADRAWLNPATFLHQERYNDEPATTDGNFTDSELDRIVLKAAGVEQLATFGGSTPRSDSIGAEGSGNCLEGEFKAR